MTVTAMWEKYLTSIGESVATSDKTYEAWYFCNNETDANHLADLAKRGIKKATSSLKKSYEIENEPLPKEKDLHIITNFSGAAVCMIEVVKVELVPFDKITEDHAKIEGEGDGSLEYWKEGHLKFFKEDAKALNFQFKENDLVVFMIFKVIHQ